MAEKRGRRGLQTTAATLDGVVVPAAPQELRERAEGILRAKAADSSGDVDAGSPAELLRIVHELRVHQIELEMQNEQLRDAQADLAAVRERYFDLYDLAPVAYFSVSEQGLIVEGNFTASTLFGVPRGALPGERFSRFLSSDGQDSFYLCSKRLHANGEAQSLELRMLRADGSSFWAQLVATLVHGIDGTQILRVVLSDISERKRVEGELREQKEFFHLIAENIGDFIAVLDPQGRRIYSSPSYARLFGNRRDLIGSDSFADVHPDDRERVKRAFRETVHTGTGQQLEYRLLLDDGGFRDIESRGSVIKDSEGRIARVLVVSHDISERKQMEAKIRKLAFHDSLTQLPNRRLLLDRLNQTLAASKRSACYAALIFLDLDNFKNLNDSSGHEAGDLLLIEVADRLKNCVREMDTVARFGGDEFLVMLSELAVDRGESQTQAEIVAEKIRVALAVPYLLNLRRDGQSDTTLQHRCTASIGVTLFNDHEASYGEILKRADIAMYQAKQAGRNSIRFYDAET
jgi:diguanylate cyclase (GGDEF)-like protein/PAS domain S-box-containing protein